MDTAMIASGFVTLKDIVRFKVMGFRTVTEEHADYSYTEVRIESTVQGKVITDKWYKVGETQSLTINLDVQ